MHLKVSSAKWRPLCLDHNVLSWWYIEYPIDLVYKTHQTNQSAAEYDLLYRNKVKKRRIASVNHSVRCLLLCVLPYPYPEPVYTGWSSVHWKATAMALVVHWDTTGRPSEYLKGTLEHHWKNVDKRDPHWNATGETDYCSLHWNTTGGTVNAPYNNGERRRRSKTIRHTITNYFLYVL